MLAAQARAGQAGVVHGIDVAPEMTAAGLAEIETGPTTYPMVSFIRGRARKA